MKARLSILLIIAVIAIAACKKEDAPAPVIIEPVNTWEYNGTKLKAVYSDIITRQGFTLVFHPTPATGLSQSLTFIFTSRPLGDKTYKPAIDTTTATSVRVHLETGSSKYTSAGNDTAQIRATIIDGKINLTGFNLKMQRDTLPNDILPLTFDLREF